MKEGETFISMKKEKNKISNVLFYFIISTLFMLFFSDNTSPLAKYWYSSDASLYMLFGKGLKYGLFPYKDLFDHKGPYFFFLQEIGQVLCEGKFGIFILQIVSLCICLIIGEKILLLVNNSIDIKRKLLLLFPLLWFLGGVLEGGNTNEEFALPFLFFSLYETLKYFFCASKNNYSHSPIVALIYGVSFSFIAFSRINNSAFLCACILSIVIILVINKEYKNLFKNIIYFIFGFIVATLPILYFYYKNDILIDMLNSCFVFAFKYSISVPLINKIKNYFLDFQLFYFLPLIIPFILFKKLDRNTRIFSFIVTLASIITVFLGYGYRHYLILLIPNIMFSIFLIEKYIIFDGLFKNKKKAVVFCILLLLGQTYYVALDFGNSLVHIIDVNITYNENHYYRTIKNESIDIINRIPESERNSIWGQNVGSRFYLRTNTFPCIKYYDFVNMYFKGSMGNVKNELLYMLDDKKPKWVVFEKDVDSVPKEIINYINNFYEIDYQNKHFILYENIK